MTTDVAAYRRWTYRLANDLAAPADVDDLAQEGMVALWKAKATLDESKGAAPPYLTRAARQRMREVALRGRPYLGEGDRSRAHGSRTHAAPDSLDGVLDRVDEGLDPLPSALVDDGPDAERLDTAARVRAAVAALPEAERVLVTLRDLLGWGAADAAAFAGLSEGGARTIRKRGHARLREALA